MFRKILALGLILTLPACIGWQREELTGRDHVSGWADQIRAGAVESYPYAQMSNNAYYDRADAEGRYDLGPELTNVVNQPNDDIGFAYSIFERRQGGRLVEKIIAFRGTEYRTRADWTEGNFRASQNDRGLDLYDRVDTETEQGVQITVTGHSLGGGIATYVSLHRAGVRAYVFNSSPRFRLRGPAQSNRRVSIVEFGELLKAGRVFGREANQTYISINCRRGLNALSQHSIRPLADCLTRIAAFDDEGARLSLLRNRIARPVGLTPR